MAPRISRSSRWKVKGMPGSAFLDRSDELNSSIRLLILFARNLPFARC
ncbi:hypothetical protein CCACVL1_13978 [Corchorus capsularis]|uniref:Uncharacterized protein n=1 Tax=Corchorus capsularis TaxID=210143 RepID=A0A1R3I8Q0_COCAP|nr:hypothetical protein CCACVL1_13978 [Corchorus capsularis]